MAGLPFEGGGERMRLFAALCVTCVSQLVAAATYEVGPGKPYQNIGDVAWESLSAGDTVLIYWRDTPYREKWVICGAGTSSSPITVRGVPGPAGELPRIVGENATTRLQLNFWSESRGVVKIGGSSVPADVASWIVVENLDISSGRPPYTFTDDGGNTVSYASNCAAIFIESGSNITIRNCILHDCGNGLFAAHGASSVLVEGCWIYDNGIENSIYEHNNYTEAEGITFQFNWFGPLRAGCPGNNLKDRSTGLVVRYNWIESGNRQLDLVDSSYFASHPDYGKTFVYGNILVEHEGDGNSQIVHFGGDSGDTANYRGKLYFYNNTVVSTRTGNTTLLRLSTNAQSCDCRSNVLYVTAAGSKLAMLDSTGVLSLRANWLKPGWVYSHGGLDPGASVVVELPNVEGSSPGFVDEPGQDYRLRADSPCIDAGVLPDAACVPQNEVLRQYVKHRAWVARPASGARDIGAFEFANSPPVLSPIGTLSGAEGQNLTYVLSAADPDPGDSLTYSATGLPPGATLNPITGEFSWTPGWDQSGAWSVTFRVTDLRGGSDSESVTIQVAEVDDDMDSDGLPDHSDPDADGDGLPNDSDLDDDNDGLEDTEELARSTDPLDPDSDNDGWTDGDEVARGTDPLDPFDSPGNAGGGSSCGTGLPDPALAIWMVLALAVLRKRCAGAPGGT